MDKLKKILDNFAGGVKNKQTYNSSKRTEKFNSSESTATSPKETLDRGQSRVRIIQNFHLVWLFGSIDEMHNDSYRHIITKLRQVVNTVNTFTDADECIDFVTDITDEKVFMISSGVLDPTTAAVANDISQVNSIYIFCEEQARHEQWATQWPKVKGVFTDITLIYEALKHNAQNCDQNSVSMSFVAPCSENSTQNLDQLDQSFMYTQILKEILLTTDFEQGHFLEFITYCREQLVHNTAELETIGKLEREYHTRDPIWWYTYHYLRYSMLNRALRTMEVDLIIKMGFFVRDLYEHINRLHSEQYTGQQHLAPFIVYRGQGVSPTDFDQMVKTKGGLMSFNNLLSTSLDREVSFAFAESNQNDPYLIAILFQITIDPSIPSTPFANIRDVSYYQGEEEILFSMHSIFRIGHIRQMGNHPRLWQVDLTLTSDNDPLLHTLTKYIQKDTFVYKGWLRLSILLIKLGQFHKAQQLCKIMLEQTTDETEKANIYYQLGWTKQEQAEYAEAIRFYKKSVEIWKVVLSPNHSDFASAYNNIGLVYEKMGEYSKALSFHEKALEIYRKTLPANHPSLGTSYNNIGAVYDKMGEHSKALSSFEKALEIYRKTLPVNHPDLATSYNNIGLMYDKMGEHTKTLSSYEKALEIRQKSLPSNHPDFAQTYYNIGVAYDKMGEYSKALSSHEKALEIFQKTVHANHPNLGDSYGNIGLAYAKMGEYSKALSCHEKALEILKKTLPANHPSLAIAYNNIGLAYDKMGEDSKALSSHEKTLEIYRKTLPENHPDLATSYNNIGLVYDKMGEYSKALSSHEKALEIKQKTLPANHPSLATSYNNIGSVYEEMGEYSKALSSFEKALEIYQKNLLGNHPSLATSYNNIGSVYDKMGEYSKALSSHEKALEIRQKSLPANHPDLAMSYGHIGMVSLKLEEYSKAILYSEWALKIVEHSLPANHPHIQVYRNNLERVKRSCK